MEDVSWIVFGAIFSSTIVMLFGYFSRSGRTNDVSSRDYQQKIIEQLRQDNKELLTQVERLTRSRDYWRHCYEIEVEIHRRKN